jgi:hypothetical protein
MRKLFNLVTMFCRIRGGIYFFKVKWLLFGFEGGVEFSKEASHALSTWVEVIAFVEYNILEIGLEQATLI